MGAINALAENNATTCFCILEEFASSHQLFREGCCKFFPRAPACPEMRYETLVLFWATS